MSVKKKNLLEVSSTPIQIVEMSSAAINGRRRMKIILHEIMADNSRWQENGLSYLREYTEQNMASVEGMSITVEFLDDERREPLGHGYSGVDPQSGMPEFNNATMVGYAHSPKIEELMVGGRNITALTAEASLDQHRYPLFVEWLYNEVNSGNTINGSIEFVGVNEGTPIQYRGGKWTKTGRVPTLYSYSGYAILGIRAADPTAIVLELNSCKEQETQSGNEFDSIRKRISELSELNIKTTTSESEVNNVIIKEEIDMDEKVLTQKFDEVLNKISEVNETKEKVITEKNSEVEDLKRKLDEIEDALEKMTGDRDDMKEKYEESQRNLEAMKSEKNELEKNTLKAELNSELAQFTEEQRGYAKDAIKAFMENPAKSEINSITGEIWKQIGMKAQADAKTMSEQNSFDGFSKFNNSLNTIFAPMDEIVETNSGGSGNFF